MMSEKQEKTELAFGDRLLTKKKAAEILDVSVRTLDRLCSQGVLSKVYVGSSPRIRFSELSKVVGG